MSVQRKLSFVSSRKKWRAVYFVPQTGKEVTRHFPTKKEGADWLEHETSKLVVGTWIDPARGSMTVDRFMELHFWPNYPNKDNTRENQEISYRLHVQPRWGSVPLDKIEKIDVVGWISELKKRTKPNGEPYSASWVRQVYWMFHAIISFAKDNDFLVRDPCPKEPKLPSDPPNADVFALEPWEVERLAVTIQQMATDNPGRYKNRCVVPDWPLMFFTLVYTYCYGGFRPSEGLALRVNDLDVENGYVRVDEQIARGGKFERFDPTSSDLKTARSHRNVPIAFKVMDMLVHHVETNIGWDNPEALLFTNKLGWAFDLHNFRARWFRPATIEIGRDGMTPHDMRHTAASAWFDEDHKMDDVAEYLGDTVEVTRKTYVHMYQGRRDKAHARMDDRVERGRQPRSNIRPLRRTREA